MGEFLSTPNREKVSEDNEDQNVFKFEKNKNYFKKQKLIKFIFLLD